MESGAKLLYQIAKKENKHEEALKYYELQIQFQDSLKNEENQKSLYKQQSKYEYEKQKAIDDAEHEKEIAIEQEAKKRQKLIAYASGGGLLMVAFFLFLVFKQLRKVRKQRNQISKQSDKIKKQHAELENTMIELNETHLFRLD
jgi:hypothetical protein